MDRAVLSKKLCNRENNLKQNNRRPFIDKTNSIMEDGKLKIKTRFGRIATRFSPNPNKLRNKNTLSITIDSSENEQLVEPKKCTLQKETIGLGTQKTPEKKNVRKRGNFNVKAVGKENTDSKTATVSKPVTNAGTRKLKQNKSVLFKSPMKGLTEDEIRHLLETDDQPVSTRPTEKQLDNCSSHTNVLNSKTDNLKETQTSKPEEERSDNKHYLRNRKIPNYALLESCNLSNPELDPKFENCYVAVEQITKSLLTSKCSNADEIWQKVHVPIWRKHVPVIPDIDMKDQLRPSQKLTLYEFNCDSPEETSTMPKRKKRMKQIKPKKTVKRLQGFKYVIESNPRLGNTGKRWHPVLVPSSVGNPSGANLEKFKRLAEEIATSSTDDRLGNNAGKTTRPIQTSSANNRSDANARKLRPRVPISSTDVPSDEPFEMETHSPRHEIDYDDRASSRCSSVISFVNHIDGLGKQPLQTSSPWRTSLPLKRSLGFEVKSSTLLPPYNQDVSKSLIISSPENSGTNSQSTDLTNQQATLNKFREKVNLFKRVTLHKSMKKHNLSNISGSTLNIQKSPRTPLRNITQNMCSTPNTAAGKKSECNIRNYFSLNQNENVSRVRDENNPNDISEIENVIYSGDSDLFVEKDNSKSRENSRNKQNIQSDNISEKENVNDSEESDFFVDEDNCNLNKNTETGKPTRISYTDIQKLKKGLKNNGDDFEDACIEPENITLPSPAPDTVGLYEDLNSTAKKVSRTYDALPNRTHKAVRFETSDSLDEDCDEENKPKKKKRRNARSKKEVMEAAKWTREFNSMCKEVDEFELVVE